MTSINAEAMLAKYLEAEAAVLDGKSITFNGRVHTMVDLSEIRRGRMEWEQRVAAERARATGDATAGGLSFSQATFNC